MTGSKKHVQTLMIHKLISDITFQELLDAMQAGYEGYAVMGHGVDSFLREAIFEELSKRSGLPYDEIYTLWLEAERRTQKNPSAIGITTRRTCRIRKSTRCTR